MDTSAYLMQVETAVEAANTAAESLSASDIMAARDAAMGISEIFFESNLAIFTSASTAACHKQEILDTKRFIPRIDAPSPLAN